MASIQVSEILHKNAISSQLSESFLNELQAHEIIFIEGGGGYYRDRGYRDNDELYDRIDPDRYGRGRSFYRRGRSRGRNDDYIIIHPGEGFY
ncbi:hypothetical protein [Nostoc sp.]|uniref:hypothetical protein n=1 Tax=Nostoc sp. TaxID=1180 RepID=UPI002FF9E0B2